MGQKLVELLGAGGLPNQAFAMHESLAAYRQNETAENDASRRETAEMVAAIQAGTAQNVLPEGTATALDVKG